MISLPVQVTDDHLMRLRKARPLFALSELIWNALDADASTVQVDLQRNLLHAVERITITDDGHGISFEVIEKLFGRLGNSHKLADLWSPRGRKYHGRTGQGRYKSFALGSRVCWHSTYRGADGGLYSFEIKGSLNNLKMFEVTDPERASDLASTSVAVTIDILDDSVTGLEAEKLSIDLAIMMAPYLLAYPDIKLAVDGFMVDPHSLKSREKSESMSVSSSQPSNVWPAQTAEVTVKILEWKSGTHRNKYLCDGKGIALDEGPSGIRVGVPSYTVYVLSDFFERLWTEDDLNQPKLDPLYMAIDEAVEDCVREYFRSRLAQEAVTTIIALKLEGVYPFKGEPSTQTEVAERQVFDICASKLNQFSKDFVKSPKSSKRLTLALLKEALERNPSALQPIFNEVLNLPDDQVKELSELLQHTTLKAIIHTAQLVRERLLFLNGLRQLLTGSEVSRKVLERRQLQPILIDQLWIFGEQYRYGVDDASLKTLLKKHLSILGRTELMSPIVAADLNDIPDIMLWTRVPQLEEGKFEHLIIELKRPKCTIGLKEMYQIERYAASISINPAFDKESTRWSFYLLGTKLAPSAKAKCNQQGRAYGNISSTSQYDIWVKEWSEVLQHAEWRMKFLQDHLELSVKDDSEGMTWLRQRYAKILTGV